MTLEKDTRAARKTLTAAQDQLAPAQGLDELRELARGIHPAALGTGLRGLADRVEALGGHLYVDSPPGRGTRIRAEIPCA
jgi:signal transduction histidine kinase